MYPCIAAKYDMYLLLTPGVINISAVHFRRINGTTVQRASLMTGVGLSQLIFILVHFSPFIHSMNHGSSKIKWGQPRSKSASVMVLQSLKKHKQWSETSMLVAFEAAKNCIPILQAVREHGVPRSTLNDIGFLVELFMAQRQGLAPTYHSLKK